MSTDTVIINDNLVKIDNVLVSLNYLLEEVQTRKEQIINAIDVNEKVKSEMNTSYFKRDILNYIKNDYGDGLYREVAFLVMDRIDNDIEAFINSRVNVALQSAGIPIQTS